MWQAIKLQFELDIGIKLDNMRDFEKHSNKIMEHFNKVGLKQFGYQDGAIAALLLRNHFELQEYRELTSHLRSVSHLIQKLG